MKISIITPSFNSGKTIERAVESVRAQGYADYEHIVVDGGSTDGTIAILERYPHVKWISERDRGQVHAMNKGFARATGEVIGYLNADDYYLDGAFSAVIPHFRRGDKMVVGKVLVKTTGRQGTREWTCDPRVDFRSMLRHWEGNAFCVNPVGYFYLREVQERIPLREEAGAKHDLEFLLHASRDVPATKIPRTLGVFNHAADTQTGREQSLPSYWRPENFPFVDRLALDLPEPEQRKFRLARERGYQLRRRRTAEEALSRGLARRLYEEEEAFPLPPERDGAPGKPELVATPGDWIIVVVTPGGPGEDPVFATLRKVPKDVLPGAIYQVDAAAVANPRSPGTGVAGAVIKLFLEHKRDLHWKIIMGVQETAGEGRRRLRGTLDAFEISVEEADIRADRKYTIGRNGSTEMLVYHQQDLPRVFSAAMEDYLGIESLALLEPVRSADAR